MDFIKDDSSISDTGRETKMNEATPKEGDIRRQKHGSYRDYFIKEVYLLCPRCGTGRWVNAYSVTSLGFTGLCQECLNKLFSDAIKPYRDEKRIIALRKVASPRFQRGI